MSKNPKDELNEYIMMAEILLRLTSLEKLLIDNKIISKDELLKVMEELSSHAAKSILEKAKIPQDLDKLAINVRNKATEKN